MKSKSRMGMALAVGVLLGLSGCGFIDDNSDNPPPVTSQVPGSASQSVAGFVAYSKALVASSADMLEPVDISAVTPQTSDDTEPAAVD